MPWIYNFYVYIFVGVAAALGFMGFVKGVNRFTWFGILTLSLLTVTLLVFRDPSAPNDASNYMSMYEAQIRFSSIFSSYHKNFLFSFFQFLGNYLGISATDFLIIQTISYFIISFLGLRLIFKNNKMFLLSLSFFVLTSTFILLFLNVIRQGLAFSLIIFSLGLMIRGHKIFGYLVLGCAVFSHFSALIFAILVGVARLVQRSRKFYYFLIILSPILPAISYFLLTKLSPFVSKLAAFAQKDYDNFLVYIKVFLLFLSAVLFYFFGVKKQAFRHEAFWFLFRVYALNLAVVFFFLPVLLISSRYLFYPSGLLPVLYTIIFFYKPNFLNLRSRFCLGLFVILIYGFFVYSFASTRQQLGL